MSLEKSFLYRSDLRNDRDVNRYIANELQSTQATLDQCGRFTDALVRYLQQNVPVSVKECIKGGSFGKGTAMKGRSDLDMVLLLNDFHNMDHFKSTIRDKLREIEQWIRRYDQAVAPGDILMAVEGKTSHAVKLTLTTRDGSSSIDVDLLPAYDNLGLHSTSQVYRDMQNSERESYSASLVQLQLKFVSEKPTQVKDLIRLVKDWRKTSFKERSYPQLPTSYPLELITIHAWEKAGRPYGFSMLQGFRAVMTMLKNYPSIDVHWNDNYNFDTYRRFTTKEHNKPFVVDPANPFNNVCSRANAWSEVAQMAQRSLSSPLLAGVSPNARWQ